MGRWGVGWGGGGGGGGGGVGMGQPLRKKQVYASGKHHVDMR